VLALAWPFLALASLIAALIAVALGRIGSAVEVALLERRGRATPVQLLAIYGGSVVGAIVLSMAIQTWVIEAFKIPSGAMIPTLQIGDHVLVNKLATTPERGAVMVFVHPCEPDKDFVKRVVGLPGDTIEVRCDVLYVNGAAAAASSLKEPCSYWDRNYEDGDWVAEDCTTYVEELDGRVYETVYSPERREVDRLRKVAGDDRDYQGLAGDGDFPRMPGSRMPACPAAEKPSAIPVGTMAASPAVAGQPSGACRPVRHYVVPDGTVFVLGDNRENSADSRSWGPVPLGHLKGKVTSIWWTSGKDGFDSARIGPID
jgi:signal peptidase I